MKMRTLYRPKKEIGSFADFYYKERIEEDKPDDAIVFVEEGGVDVPVCNVKLVGVNTCTGARDSDHLMGHHFTSFRSLKKELGLPDDLLVDFLFCPVDCFSSEPTVTGIPKGTVMKVSILVTPDD